MQRLAPLLAVAALAAACARPAVPPPALPEPLALPASHFELAEEEEERAAEEADRILEDEARPSLSQEESVLGFALDPARFDLPLVVNDRVVFWINYFATRHRERFATYLRRMGRYEAHIHDRLRERGLPEDLIYLALIESGFAPRAYSRAHAVGIWQFIPGTGRRYGLEQTAYLDERRDPVKSTEAALTYLAELHDRFGSWYLAAAAYNSGENRVERLLQQRAGGARGHDSLYWHISAWLPAETRNYVPKMLAAAIVAKHREHFGFDDVEPEPVERWEAASIPDATDLAVVAELAGAPEADIRMLNPHFVQGITPPRRRVAVRLPIGSAEEFGHRYALLPADRRVRFLHHTVTRGETLSGIARQYGTTVAALQDANGIRNPGSIRAGARLVIPKGSGSGRGNAVRTAAAVSAQPARPERTGSTTAATGAATHHVAAGETLWAIARQHAVTVEDLRRWNGLAGDRIVVGQKLVVTDAAVPQVITHQVRAGDTLWGIARRHGVTPRQLMEWNDLAEGAVLRPGDRVEIRR